MSSDATNQETNGSATTGRSRVRLGLVAGCVLVVVLAALLVPTLGSGELAGTPIDSVLPGERFDGSGEGPGTGSGSGFGALNPGDQTGVGGETGFDGDTFGSNDTTVHFEIESSEPAYWRTGAYDSYTGTGWEQTGDSQPFEPPLAPQGLTDGTMEFDLTLAEPASAIPTAWQPQDLSGVENAMVTGGGSIQVPDTLDPGTTISGVSQVQEDDIDLLRSAGEDYPGDIEAQYTQLPGDTPTRVEEFTGNLTAGDETPYDAAVTIQEWLRSNKEYSLEADQQSEHITDTFLFEMDAGYCEYFATAMTTMLRSQDIPARYTVGYTTGQQIEENTYEVRGMNAHAWVEVYFPEVGWVQFDPTPGGSRLDAQSSVLEDELDEAVGLEEPGSPGETFRPDEIIQDNSTDSDSNGTSIDGEYDISLNQTAVPGLPVEIGVTEDGEPVIGLTVTVNGNELGMTDGNGTVTMIVPDTEELDISVQSGLVLDDDKNVTDGGERDRLPEEFGRSTMTVSTPDSSPPTVSTSGGTPLTARISVTGGTSSQRSEDTVVYRQAFEVKSEDVRDGGSPNTSDGSSWRGVERQSLPPTGPRDTMGDSPPESTRRDALTATRRAGTQPDDEANTTVQVETGATLSVTGDVLPGTEVTVTATVQDVSIPDATVFVDGNPVGTTDENGRATVVLPEDPGDVLLEIERGSVRGQETVTVPDVALSVSTGALPLPLSSATVSVRAGDQTVTGAPVVVDGTEVATTNADGRAEIRLPIASSATIETSMYGLDESTTVDGLVRNLGLVVAGLLVGVALPAVIVRRRGITSGQFIDRLRAVLGRIQRYSQLLLLGVVRYSRSWLGSIPGRLRKTVVYILNVFRGRATLRELRTLFGTWLQTKRRRIRGDESGETAEQDVVEGIQRAWLTFLSQVSADPSGHTPGELAAHAVGIDGFPADAVGTVLTAFREVEYGNRPEPDRLEDVEAALVRIDRESRETDPPSAQPDTPVDSVSADGGTSADSTTAPADERHTAGDGTGGSR